MTYVPTIGLEIHAELKTRTKMFCGSLNDPDETHPNVNICPICMGHPGTLPVINREAVEKVIQVGLALSGKIAEFAQFDRKNYFYPDLPKGYQISQYEHPIVRGGWLEIRDDEGGPKRIRLQRVHLEEDTGRLTHDPESKSTLVDFNRAGIPLMELVTEPDMTSTKEARLFAEHLRMILQYLDASYADMEKGEMRIEANVSLHPVGSSQLGTKVELKNINSFRFVEKAVAYEILRQGALLRGGKPVVQETRGWDEVKQMTVSQRLKEESQDYRYFPEPDLPPLRIDRTMVEELRVFLPELPLAKLARFEQEYDIDSKLAETLVRDRYLAGFFEATVSELGEWLRSRGLAPQGARPILLAANYLTTDVARILAGAAGTIRDSLLTPENFAELITYLAEEKISSKVAKEVLAEMFASGADPSVIIDGRKLWQISGADALGSAVEKIVTANPKAVADYRAGKTTVLQFLVGQVMKESKGANPETVQAVLKEKLK